MLGSPRAFGQLNIEYGGRIQSNVRFQINDVEAGNFYDQRRFEKGVARNEHILKFRGAATSDRFSGIIDIDFVWLNLPRDVGTFEDLSLRENVEPTRFEAHAAYIEGLDLFVDGLDLRVGQQIVAWGVGDGFNPTNNLNADDVEDRLLYGIQQANLMARLSYSYEDAFSADAVLVPVFRPALLPTTGAIALALVDRLPMLDAGIRHRLAAENAFSAEEGSPTRVADINVDTPDASFDNMQFAFRLATTIAEQDIAISYYQGFSDIPLPAQNFTAPVAGPVCDPADETNCVDGTLDTTTTLTYPKIKVVGLNMSGEMDPLGWISDDINPIGYRIEVGLYLPEQRRLRLFQDNISIGPVTVDGEYDYNGINTDGLGEAPLVLDSTPYAKWVVGLDYTFNQHVYLNVQWVHGLVEEVGAGDWLNEGYTVRQSSATPNVIINSGAAEEVSVLQCALFANSTLGLGQNPEVCAREILRPRIGDYIVLGLDFMFDSSRGLFRLFSIFDVTTMIEERWNGTQRVRRNISPFSDEGFSMVLFPELNYNFGNGFELGGGALVFFGKDYTKFGDPAAGGSIIWTRARYSF
ncbi:MAG: DUF1302 family protein [Myxococcota bacterium]